MSAHNVLLQVSKLSMNILSHAAIQHCRALNAAKTDCFEMILTVILQHKLDERAQLKWVEFNSDSEMPHHVLNS